MKITEKELRKLIREQITKLNEYSTTSDPTFKEMYNYLKKQYKGLGFDDGSARAAIYWFAYNYHGGMSSNVYQSIPKTEYKPSRLMSNIEDEDDYLAKEMYTDLENNFG